MLSSSLPFAFGFEANYATGRALSSTTSTAMGRVDFVGAPSPS
jgi:hypothetical protein